MAIGTVFSALAAQAHAEKVAAAVAEVLRGNSYAGDTEALAAADKLADAIPATKVFLCPDQFVQIDAPPPWIAVCRISQSNQNLLSAEQEKSITVRLYYAYNEYRSVIGITDKTVAAAMRYAEAAIVASGTLRVTAFSSVALVKRIASINAVDYGTLIDGAPVRLLEGELPVRIEGGGVSRSQIQEFVFEYNVEAFTGDSSNS